jgi:hypothetical protein
MIFPISKLLFHSFTLSFFSPSLKSFLVFHSSTRRSKTKLVCFINTLLQRSYIYSLTLKFWVEASWSKSKKETKAYVNECWDSILLFAAKLLCFILKSDIALFRWYYQFPSSQFTHSLSPFSLPYFSHSSFFTLPREEVKRKFFAFLTRYYNGITYIHTLLNLNGS